MMKAIQWWRYWHGLDSPLGHMIPVLLIVVQIAGAFTILLPPMIWAVREAVGPWWAFWLRQ